MGRIHRSSAQGLYAQIEEMTVRADITKTCILLFITFLVFAPGFSAEAQPPDQSELSHRYTIMPDVYLNEDPLPEDLELAIDQGIVFIALSSDLEFALGVSLSYDMMSTVTKIELRSPDATIVFEDYNSQAIVNGVPRELLLSPYMLNGYLYVPLDALFTYLGGSVKMTDTDITVTKRDTLDALINEIPESFLERKSEEKEAEAETAETTTAEAIPPPDTALQYTYENRYEFENVTVSGNEALSNLTPKTDYSHKLNFRAMQNFSTTYKMQTILRTSETTDRELNLGEVTSFNVSIYNQNNHYSLYDNAPKISRYVLKSYQTRGIIYKKKIGGASLSGIWGKTPQKLRETQYKRYLQGALLDVPGEKKSYGASFVRIKDAGIPRDTARLDNRVFSVFVKTNGKAFKTNAEIARSDTSFYYNNRTQSLAKWIEVDYRNRTTSITSSYERVGTEFYSETSFFTPGRREFVFLLNHRLSKQFILGGGYRNVRLMGESTMFIPLQINLSPLSSRPKMRLKLQDNFEKARSPLGTRITDKKKFTLSDRFGDAKFDFIFERRKQKDTFAEWSFRTSRRYRYITPLSDKIMLILQQKSEYKSTSTNPRKRYYQAKFSYELDEWSEFSINLERYYNNTANDRKSTSLIYRKLDIFNDREYTAELGLSDYSEHNDIELRLAYSFYK